MIVIPFATNPVSTTGNARQLFDVALRRATYNLELLRRANEALALNYIIPFRVIR